MIPLAQMPGFGAWGRVLEALLARPELLWLYGSPGSGVSTIGKELAEKRGTAFLDDADLSETSALNAWVEANPRGVLGAHRTVGEQWACLELRLSNLDEDPHAIAGCLQAFAEEEKIEGELPSMLSILPCPGELRGLRNRLLRWKFMGQLPNMPSAQEGVLPLDVDDFATNLHVLERLLLHRALRRSYGNRVEAAHRLGISRRQLYLLIARHGDPVRGESPTSEGPKRLGKARMRQNSSYESTPR